MTLTTWLELMQALGPAVIFSFGGLVGVALGIQIARRAR